MTTERLKKKIRKTFITAEKYFNLSRSYSSEANRLLDVYIEEHHNLVIVQNNGEVRNIKNLKKINNHLYNFCGEEDGNEVYLDYYLISNWVANDEVLEE